MSVYVWIFWGVLTVVNVALWVACWRHVHTAAELLVRARAALSERDGAAALADDARAIADSLERWNGPRDSLILATLTRRIRALAAALTEREVDSSEHTALPEPVDGVFRPWCRDCGPGYRRGDDGCRHDDYQPEPGETGVCRTCAQPIWWETGEIGHRERLGWSDRIKRGGDSLVCFKARDYRHVPMGAREAAIYQAGLKAGQEAGRG